MPPREPWYKGLPLTWPVIATILALAASTASSSARIDDLSAKVQYIWDRGPPPVAERLARMDEREQQMSKTLDRVEHKLDGIDAKQNGR